MFCAIFFVLGYLAGRIDLLRGSLKNISLSSSNGTVERQQSSITKKKVEIDDSKYVTNVETDTYDRGYSELGKVTVANDNVNEAASKLLQLKKK